MEKYFNLLTNGNPSANPTVYMMVGLPGSGKSYLATTFDCPVISSDDIRAELCNGNLDDKDNNEKVFQEVHRRIKDYLKNGQSCVLDATNLSRKRRKYFVSTVPSGVNKVAVVVATELPILLRQNSERDHIVPEEAIMRYYKTISIPRKDEGWDEIRVYPHPENKKILKDYLAGCLDVANDNEHHNTPDIATHMIKSMLYVHGHYCNGVDIEVANPHAPITTEELAAVTALYHDIGKPVVKSRIKPNGEEDTQSHYFNHAEVGAYILCCSVSNSDIDSDVVRDMVILTQHHMDPFFVKDYEENFRNLYGEELTKAYNILHEANRYAH